MSPVPRGHAMDRGVKSRTPMSRGSRSRSPLSKSPDPRYRYVLISSHHFRKTKLTFFSTAKRLDEH